MNNEAQIARYERIVKAAMAMGFDRSDAQSLVEMNENLVNQLYQQVYLPSRRACA